MRPQLGAVRRKRQQRRFQGALHVSRQPLSLRAVTGELQGRSWDVAGPVRIGRLSTLEIVLNHASISRVHARIDPAVNGWTVQDLGSTNGTFVNRIRVGPTGRPLQDKDILVVGDVTLLACCRRQEHDLSQTTPVEVTTDVVSSSLELGGNTDFALRVLQTESSVISVASMEELTRSILNDAMEATEADYASLFLVQPGGRHLTQRAIPRRFAAGPALPLACGMVLVERAWEGNKTLCCPDVARDTELAKETPCGNERVHSMLCVVLRTPQIRLGVMQFARLRDDRPFQAREVHLAELLCRSAALTLESTRGLVDQERRHLLQTLTALAQAIELRDEYTSGHTTRVTRYADLLAEELDLSGSTRQLLQVGTPLHDIGKIGISDAILQKPGPLTPEEMEYMKSHTVKGAQMLEALTSLSPLLPIVRSHHERWDGTGYPDGLQREQIPPLGRIVAVADAFDAMTSDRPYRPALPMDQVFEELQARAGTQFDPHFVRVFVGLRSKLEAIHHAAAMGQAGSPSGIRSLALELAARARNRTLARPRPPIRSRSG